MSHTVCGSDRVVGGCVGITAMVTVKLYHG